LFIATFSLNETTLSTRKIIEPLFKQFDYIFIIYNREFEGVNNIKYFEDLAVELRPYFNVVSIKDTHRDAWFLLCSKENNPNDIKGLGHQLG
jgi:hypothetical protein